ncbi:uncharacterized protein Camp [Chelonus insularis]|uniref:uncharacterized protein Camp n=1 Tax=Chelonus insularis TaxID=460826 RepID=UPI001589A13D|nr:uncharacterized protein LOC118074598 [Chelonus insularis]
MDSINQIYSFTYQPSFEITQHLMEVGLKAELHRSINEACGSGKFGIERIVHEQELVELTGLSFMTFDYIVSSMQNYRDTRLSMPNKLLLTLIKLRRNESFHNLHIMFEIDVNTVYEIFVEVLNSLWSVLHGFIHWPTRELVKSSLPPVFDKYHPNARVIKEYITTKIKDNQDISLFQGQSTAKFLVGISPTGVICFVSKCYAGTTENSFVTENSGLLDLVDPRDVIICTKESSNHCDEVLDYIGTLKQRIVDFNILSNVSSDLLPHMNRIAFVVCALVNAQTLTDLKIKMMQL